MTISTRPAVLVLLLVAGTVCAQTVSRSEANNGQLIMEDVPAIPQEVVDSLNRFQNLRSARFMAWQEDSSGLYISTRFGLVNQLHRVDNAGGARYQITFNNEPLGAVAGQPQGSKIAFTRDAGGSEFSQIFLLDPETGNINRVTDGESRNRSISWDRGGRRIAYASTRRNGASNDIWLMDPEDPEGAEIILESPDGTFWGPSEFSASGTRLLALNYISVADSRVYVVDLDSGENVLLAGGSGTATTNYPVAFDDEGDGFWLITSEGSDFQNLAWQPLAPGAGAQIITGDINWDVTGAVISADRRRIAFTVNENGMSRPYLMDARSRAYRPLDNVPVGLAVGLEFSPDNSKLAMTFNTASSPSDTYVLNLGEQPLDYGQLDRWTTSEVGGLDITSFRSPNLITYPTFDEVDGKPRMIPAWVYKPAGKGRFPVVVSIHGGPRVRRGRSSVAPTRCGCRSSVLPWWYRMCAARTATARSTSRSTMASGAKTPYGISARCWTG